MTSWEPSFRRCPNGSLSMNDSAEVKIIKSQHRENDRDEPLSAAAVRLQAETIVKNAGGDITNSKHLLGCFEIQFGQFRFQLHTSKYLYRSKCLTLSLSYKNFFETTSVQNFPGGIFR
ncbi:hypothetical protein DPMN_041893 [Dreissena polymorpha]|uniref:Uncharacterized protein n=1 Tax=Dreissena polymorpha TaxID=45954 RepID=A0A9D4CXQ2_DREPO|nr:hypothetical protein DPMN_041893 [Dreissena polymorpha]